jgi:cyclopropane fatty-acyl-phospholipid synthase-like methyltransferase
MPSMAEELDRSLREMREDWDKRARENARHYVATGKSDWSDDEFFASGEAEVEEQIRNDLANICQGLDPKRMRILEIGCGAGRVTRALARVFGEVHGVDISAEMIEQSRAALAHAPNAFVYQNNGMDLSAVPPGPYDFAFSVIVFQHIPSLDVIENYFREVHRLLRAGALFKVQMQGRAETPRPPEPPAVSDLPLHWRLTKKIPLPIRERYLRPLRPSPPPAAPPPAPDTWIGQQFTPDEALALTERLGFDLRYQHGAGTQEYWWWCFKT